MKSNQRTPTTKESHEFWRWFRENAEAIATRPTNAAILEDLDRRLRDLDPRLSWEIGPGLNKPWQFVISPNLNRNLRGVARSIISRAPVLDDWEFHSGRQPKDWNYSFEIESTDGGRKKRVSAAGWTFVLLQYPDGIHEILFKAEDSRILNADERSQAAAIVLESVLGEDMLLDAVDDFELVDELEPRFVGKQRPIEELYRAVAGVQRQLPRRATGQSIN
jgi:hypothetical protein